MKSELPASLGMSVEGALRCWTAGLEENSSAPLPVVECCPEVYSCTSAHCM